MSLFTENMGEGPDLVLLHGWGAHGGIWSELAERLKDSFHLTIVDLPGSGRSPPFEMRLTLEDLCSAIMQVAPANAIWLGWSLGALLVQSLAATDSQRVSKMILVGSSPCFVKKPGWDCATPEKVLNDFARLLRSDYRQTLLRFLSLQMGESPETRRVLRMQRELLFKYGEPDNTSLEEMLELLIHTDLRGSLGTLVQPALLIHGSHDTLAPLAAAEYMQKRLTSAELLTIDGGGHIPFLTHTEQCANKIKDFCFSVRQDSGTK